MGRTVHWDICRKNTLMFPTNDMNTKVYLLEKMSLLKYSGALTFKRTI